jgi:hypothetical protein
MRRTTNRNIARAVSTLLLWSGASLAQDLALTRSAKSGVDSLIGYERAWNRFCSARRSTVTITRQPANGVAHVAEGMSRIPGSTPRSGSTGQCAGQMIAGNQVMYRSNPGFHGTDFISWDVQSEVGVGGHVDVTIEVR